MKIAILLETFDAVAGTERVVLNLYEGFKAAGHTPVIVMMSRFNQKLRAEYNLDVVECGLERHAKWSRRLMDWAFRRKFARHEKQHGEFDLVLSNYPTSRTLISHARDRFFTLIHIDDYPTAVKRGRLAHMQKRLQKRFNHKNVITVSEGIEQHFLHKFNVKPHAIRTIYNPIDVEAIRTLAEQPCKELPAEPYLCHAARFDPQKRHDVLLEAYAKLPAKSRPKLMLLTTPCIALTQLVAYYDVAEDVIIKAFVQNPYVYFKHAELCMLSSDCEGFGLVIAESLACGTPVVSTRAPSGPEEILVGEMASWLVPVGDSDALAAKVTELLRIKPKVPSGALQCFQVGRIVLEYASLIAP